MSRSLPDTEPNTCVDDLATRISGVDKGAIVKTKHLVKASLQADVEIDGGWFARPGGDGRHL